MSSFGGFVARAFYYPSILLNVVATKATGGSWYNRVNDHVFLGAIPLPHMTKQLTQDNVKGVISLNEDYELKYIYNTEQAWTKAGIKTLRLATQDLFATPTICNINKAIDFIKEIKNDNGTVLVHCKAGKTRSTTVVVCYLIHSEGMNPDEAYRFVKAKRPQAWLRKAQLDCVNEFYQQELQASK